MNDWDGKATPKSWEMFAVDLVVAFTDISLIPFWLIVAGIRKLKN
jgi:hypothetical protein